LQTEINLKLGIRVAGPAPEAATYGLSDPTVLQQDVTPSQRKLGAALWLLSQLRSAIQNESAALTIAELLVTTARSTTFSLQKQFSKSPGFDDWYSERQSEMKLNDDLKSLIGLRNAAEKEGFVFARYAHRILHRTYRNGEFDAELAEPELEIEGFESIQFLGEISRALDALKLVIDEAHVSFDNGKVPRKRGLVLEYMRETDDGREHYDLPSTPKVTIDRSEA